MAGPWKVKVQQQILQKWLLRSKAWKDGNRPGMDILKGQGQQSRTK